MMTSREGDSGSSEGRFYTLFRALRRAAAEHGWPNSFSPSELTAFYGAPDPMRCGYLARTPEGKALLLEMGITYEDRRFWITKDPR